MTALVAAIHSALRAREAELQTLDLVNDYGERVPMTELLYVKYMEYDAHGLVLHLPSTIQHSLRLTVMASGPVELRLRRHYPYKDVVLANYAATTPAPELVQAFIAALKPYLYTTEGGMQ